MNKRILAVCGSVRARSSNLSILNFIKGLIPEGFIYEIFDGLEQIPSFNPDHDHEPAHESVARFRKKVLEADGILFCTPEYAFGVPGVLKNALDWTVSSGELTSKKVAVITASTGGEKAHESLLQTLTALSTQFSEDETLVISFIRSKINNEGKFTSLETEMAVTRLLQSFINTLSS